MRQSKLPREKRPTHSLRVSRWDMGSAGWLFFRRLLLGSKGQRAWA